MQFLILMQNIVLSHAKAASGIKAAEPMAAETKTNSIIASYV